MRWLLPLLTFLGCAHAPPPAVRAEAPVGTVADLAGTYTADNEVDWGYFLTIDKAGAFDLVVDRGKMGRCEQRGTLAAGADARTFSTVFQRNECDRAHLGAKLSVHVDSFTGDQLVLAITGDGVEEHRRFTRKAAAK